MAKVLIFFYVVVRGKEGGRGEWMLLKNYIKLFIKKQIKFYCLVKMVLEKKLVQNWLLN